MNRLKQAFQIIFVLLVVASCSKDSHAPLIDNPGLKDIDLRTGVLDNVIPVNGTDWQVEYVKIASSGESLLDTEGSPMVLKENEEVQDAEGWITLKRTGDKNDLSVSLKENFSESPRTILIGLSHKGSKEEVSITQRRGKSYQVVGTKFEEVEGSHVVYTTDEDCFPITLSNTTSQEQWLSTDDIFREVYYRSEFKSTDYGAFDWISDDTVPISVPDLMEGDAIVWSGFTDYQAGEVKDSFVGEGRTELTLLVQPGMVVDLEGSVTYAERIIDFTLTVQNEESGHRFDISGTWHQKVPISHSVWIK